MEAYRATFELGADGNEMPSQAESPSERELLRILRDADDWNQVANTKEEQIASGKRIRARAWAADMLSVRQASSPEVFAALEERVRHRSLHKDWLYQGLDGAMAMRTLILLHAPNATATARFVLWRDDASLEPVVDARWNNPRAWTDFRVKMVVFPALEKSPGEAAEKLCRDYLALSDEEAQGLAPPLFAEAAKNPADGKSRNRDSLGAYAAPTPVCAWSKPKDKEAACDCKSNLTGTARQ